MRHPYLLVGVLLSPGKVKAWVGKEALSAGFCQHQYTSHKRGRQSHVRGNRVFRDDHVSAYEPQQQVMYRHPYPATPASRRRHSGVTFSAANYSGSEDVHDGDEAASDEEISTRREDPSCSAGVPRREEGEATGAQSSQRQGGDVEEDDGEPLYLPTGASNDIRLFRAKLRAGSEGKWQEQLKRNVNQAQLGGQDAWAHELSAPEKGCLIVAKSSVFSVTQTYFNEAVILLASHDENGSAGFILNRPTTVCLGDLIEGDALPEFRETPLYLGGDVGEGNVQILHPFGPDRLPGAAEVIPGVFIGGSVEEADRMVARGRAKRDDFRFFLHLCGWAPGQLESEIQRGVWFPAATSTNVIMKHCLQLPVPLWREIMTLMGPKFGLLARDTYDDL